MSGLHRPRTAAGRVRVATPTPKPPSGTAGDDGGAFDPFTVNDAGVWHQGVNQEGKKRPPEWVCSRLEVEALTRDQDGDGTKALATPMNMGPCIATATTHATC